MRLLLFLTKNAKELNNYFKDAIKILKVDILYDYFFFYWIA